MKQRIKLLLLVAISSLVFVVVSYQISRHVIDQVVADLLWKYASVSAHYDAHMLLPPIIKEAQFAEKIAKHPNITSWGQNSGDDVYRQVGEETLENYRWQFKSKNFFIVLDDDLGYYYNDVDSVQTGSYFRHYLEPGSSSDQWYFEQKSSGKPLTVNIQKDTRLELTRLWINQSIYKDGRFLGIVGTGIETSSLFEQLVHHHSSELRTMFVDEDKRVQMEFDGENVEYPQRAASKVKPHLYDLVSNPRDYQALEELMLRQKRGMESEVLAVQQGKGSAVVAIKYIEELGWYELTFVSVDEMMPAWAAYAIYIPLTLATFAFGLACYIYVVRNWLIPTEQCKQRLATIASGAAELKGTADHRLLELDCYLDVIDKELCHSRCGVESLVAMKTKALDELTIYDPVTHLHNKRGLEQELKKELARSARERYQFGLLWIDTSLHKTIDDSKENSGYEQALMMVAEGLLEAVREYDVAARWADDEFLVLVRSEQAKTLRQISKRIMHHIEKENRASNRETSEIELSIGGILVTPDMSMRQALALTDSSLYIAKSERSSRIYIHTPPTNRKSA
ncbi:diguanylate cyclase [Vibrio aquaticus]|uniref:Diguanylate cyclase n=1 Tax=Vibrio aquaticus TaxID=2496559 RepID=A0A432CVL0_9VIBR|nr:GGDEF domain-containing protein [Vibrio aquaticus]RTZ15753.1 diguanylate cyclase [Vibrio aquaticus]